jgi:hypothetical protein
MRKALVLVFASFLLVLGQTASADPEFDYLNPGGPAVLAERVPVNFVFLGYDERDVDVGAFLGALPESYEPVVRSRLWYGIEDRLGIRYTYDYEVTFTGDDYEADFFGELARLAEPKPLTLFQSLYNAQRNNVLDVRDNHWIDAPSVERWLAQNPPPGVDTDEYTVFFVNWWGRGDFRHHVYVKTDEPDPDTGYNFGLLRESRKLIAWGGTTADDEETGLGSTHRIWFYDLSAGPESWTDNWNVDTPDLDGNGIEDYRMPPIWEYTLGGYRDPEDLTADLAKVARYVAIDLLFTTSPLYPPDLTPPALPEAIDVDSNTYEGWKGVTASDSYIKPSLVEGELAELQPLASYSTDRERYPFADDAKRCYQLWLKGARCYPHRPYPAFANLFLYNALNLQHRLDGEPDYEVGVFNYATSEPRSAPTLGFADDNWRDGTQSGVFGFVSPGIVRFGYGLTTTMIHEVGHHVGMSHPHDGYDSEDGVDFGPADGFYFAWSGDEVNSIMSYIDLNWDFSQFDRDNMARFMTAAYFRNANAVAAEILASEGAAEATDELETADDELALAVRAFAEHRYEEAASHAKDAYEWVLEGAADAGVAVEGSTAGWALDPPTRSGRPVGKSYAAVDPLAGTHRARP